MWDIGVNLASGRLLPRAEALLHRAEAAGVSGVIITGSDEDSNREAAALCQRLGKHFSLYFTAGHHPHHADHWRPAAREQIERLATNPHCVAVGEMGLDYFRNCSTPAHQRQCFADQLAIARRLGKPVFLHEREAYADFRAQLCEALPDLAGAVWHCFTGSRAQMEELAAEGVYFGITGWLCDPRRGAALREVVAHIPADRLMIETDAPYLTPKTLQPTPHCNEPAYLAEVLRVLAQCRNEEPAALAAQTTANTKRFFGL